MNKVMYKVISTSPNLPFVVGDVLTQHPFFSDTFLSGEYYVEDPERYPHIFQRVGHTSLQSILQEVAAERARQDAKWGEQNHNPVEWISILTEEVGEVAKEALENHFQFADSNDLSNYRKELIQVAAVAVQMVECLDRNSKP